MIYGVEDEKNIRELIVYTLNSAGFEAEGFESSAEFFKNAKLSEARLILLDIMLPGEDGISILKKLRANKEHADTPVIMITAKDSEIDKVTGLDAGADDYITKPFGMMEFLARVRAILRRSEDKKSEDRLTYKKLSILKSEHLVISDTGEIELTLKEYRLLEYLMENIGIVLTRDMLLLNVWDYETDVETRTVDVHVRTLRQKLGECGEYIETIRGVGYKIGGRN